MKLWPKADDSGTIVGYVFFCPGCGHQHIYYVTGPVTWEFNGDMNAPTFTPSLLNTCETHPDPKQRRCHIQLTSGRITYYADCSHDLAGREVDMVDCP